ncbi:hypothetical protein E2C01_095410 [Portunus trituberculatus]|uniref:Uncharacterized protein n=1 Tax=Portunus trituberculatus TaxID=210409 RepID=A0A5B7K029_PORTR|nr:hypothetical protein [Portunus trituberculatus]
MGKTGWVTSRQPSKKGTLMTPDRHTVEENTKIPIFTYIIKLLTHSEVTWALADLTDDKLTLGEIPSNVLNTASGISVPEELVRHRYLHVLSSDLRPGYSAVGAGITH